jgi:hypothetical protein
LVLELRLEQARTTKDVDLRLLGSSEDILSRLREAGRLDLGDFMTFEIDPDAEQPEIDGDGVIYDGRRFRAECRLAGKLYGQRFGIDVVFGGPIYGQPELLVAQDLLSFAGIAPPTVRLLPIETHIAEKLHAYTLPRSRPNSRVKDLPDLALLATAHAAEAKRVSAALEQTFGFRKTHPIPSAVPSPPPIWADVYSAMAVENGLAWPDLETVTAAVRSFLDPVLGSEPVLAWDPASWAWRRRGSA